MSQPRRCAHVDVDVLWLPSVVPPHYIYFISPKPVTWV